MDDNRCFMYCPVCGKFLVRINPGSDCEIKCERCKNTVLINFKGEGQILVGYGLRPRMG